MSEKGGGLQNFISQTWGWRAWLVFIALAVFGLRLPGVFNAAYYINSDNSLVGLMAMHISQGLHYPLYYYGQGYMGTAEAYILALAFAILKPSAAVMALVNSLFYVCALVIWAFWVRRLAGGLVAGACLLMAALAPHFFIAATRFSLGGYMAAMIIGLLFLLVWSRANLSGRGDGEGLPVRTFVLMALLLGLGLWTWSYTWLFFAPALLLHIAAILQGAGFFARGLDKNKPSRLMGYIGMVKWAGAAYALFAVTVLIIGDPVNIHLFGQRVLGTSPKTAAAQDLPIGLVLMLAGIVIERLGRLKPGSLKLALLRHKRHSCNLLAALCGMALKLGIDLWFQASGYYAWGHIQHPTNLVPPGRVMDNAVMLFDEVIPYVWRLTPPLDSAWISLVFFFLILLGPAFFVLSQWPAIKSQPLKWAEHNFVFFASCFGLGCLILAVLITNAAEDRFSARYFYMFVIWYPLVLLYPVKKLTGFKKLACTLTAGTVLLASGLSLAIPSPEAVDHARIARENDLAPLLDLMDKQKVTYGYADYWLAYNLSFLSNEKLMISPSTIFPYFHARYLPYAQKAELAKKKAYIFRNGYRRLYDKGHQALFSRFSREKVNCRLYKVDGFVVLITG